MDSIKENLPSEGCGWESTRLVELYEQQTAYILSALGEINEDYKYALITDKTRFECFSHNPQKPVDKKALEKVSKELGVPVTYHMTLVEAAQAMRNKELDYSPQCDILFSVMGKKHSIEVQEFQDGFGDSYIEIPPVLLEKLGWEEGGDLKFIPQPNGSIIIKKVNLERVEVDFDDDELFKYMQIAHERGLTFSELCQNALGEALTKMEFEGECG